MCAAITYHYHLAEYVTLHRSIYNLLAVSDEVGTRCYFGNEINYRSHLQIHESNFLHFKSAAELRSTSR